MTNQIHPYEPLTSQNAALVLVDHQVGLMTGVRDYSTGELKHNVVALAKAAKALKLPIIATTTARDSIGVRRSRDSSKRYQASRSWTVRR
jgi:nicotinamidase-related amidase